MKLNSKTPAGEGIACAGHWVVDRTKVVERFPDEGSLATIQEEVVGSGGCAYNVIMNLARLDSEIPLTALGVIGQDPDGDRILDHCHAFQNIDLRLTRTDRAPTDYTDAYASRTKGSRTFFSRLGASRLFGLSSVDLDSLRASIFHLGYLTLLEALDAEDPDFGRVSARLLKQVRDRGIYTSMDLVSSQQEDYSDLVMPALQHTDLLLMNELEAERLTGISLERTHDRFLPELRRLAAHLMERTALRCLVIHFPEGAYALRRTGEERLQPSLRIPPEKIRGTAGAGDAFSAGFLYGLYRRLSLKDTLLLAVCAAAQSLFEVTTTDAMKSYQEVLLLEKQFEFRTL